MEPIMDSIEMTPFQCACAAPTCVEIYYLAALQAVKDKDAEAGKRAFRSWVAWKKIKDHYARMTGQSN
jgi:hypothetical protein